MAFPFNKNQFNIRFNIDIYHMLYFLINGIFISDYYLSNHFERFFTSKFLEYTKTEHPYLRSKIELKEEKTLIQT